MADLELFDWRETGIPLNVEDRTVPDSQELDLRLQSDDHIPWRILEA